MNEPLFSAAELAKTATEAEEAQREADAYCEWLRSPEGRAWADQVLQEARAMAAEFEAEIAAGKFTLSADGLDQLRRDAEAFAKEVRAGKFDLTSDEIEQLRRDGILRKCHTRKREGDPNE